MAELLGVISSVITLVEVAGTLGKTTITLKRLWDEVQDVPASIQRYMEQLELLIPALEEMEDEFQRTRSIVQNDTMGKRSLEFCHKAAKELERMVLDMEQQVESARKGKRTLARVKVRLKKGIVEDHQERLQSALQLLSLSQQTYLIALSRIQPSIIVSELRRLQDEEKAEENPPLPVAKLAKAQIPDDTRPPLSRITQQSWPQNELLPWRHSGLFGRFSYRAVDKDVNIHPLLGSHQVRVHQARLQFPSWLMQKAWDFHVSRALDGWKFQLKPYYVHRDLVHLFWRPGMPWLEPSLLIEALRTGKASLYDRDMNGLGLLDIAILLSYDYKPLIDMGLKISNLNQLTLLGFPYPFDNEAEGMARIGGLVEDWDEEDEFYHLFDFSNKEPHRWVGCLLALHGLFDRVAKINTLDDMRWHINEHLNSDFAWDLINPQVFLKLANRNELPTAHALRGLPASRSNTLWHFIAVYVSWVSETYQWRPLARWLLSGISPRELVQLTSKNLSFLSPPFSLFMKYHLFWWYHRPPRCLRLENKLLLWLEDLFEAGVDLEQYVHWEIATAGAEEHPTPATKPRPGLRFRPQGPKGPALIVLRCGLNPRDWEFEFDVEVERYVGEFWRLVTLPEQTFSDRIPGSWIEVDEGDSEYLDDSRSDDSL